MNSRTLLRMLVTLVALVALAVAVSFSQRDRSSAGDLLLPDLRAQINDIDHITLRTGGTKTLATLVRRDDGWVLAERHDYAADMGRIRKNLIALAEARILEEKTANPEFYHRLDVEDIEKDSAGGLELTLAAGENRTVLLIGRQAAGGNDQVYVRRSGEAASWLVAASLDLPREASQWLDRQLTDIKAARVRSVTISQPGGEILRIGKATAEATDFTVAELPAGRQLPYPAVANPIAGALDGLTFEDVEPAAGFDPGSIKPVTARFETFDGLVIEAKTWKLAAGERVAIHASASTEALQAEATAINARLARWTYTLPEFKGEQLTRKLADLLQPLPPSN